MIWFLLMLGVACVIGVFIWDYRRKAAGREAARQQRFNQIFKAKTEPETSTVAPVPDSPAAAAPAPAAQLRVAAFPPKDRFLGQRETLVYLLLRTGLPDHQVFANVTLASVLDVPGGGYDREQQLRRLSTYALDFVVCDRNMRVVAVVDLESPGSVDAAGVARYKSESLKAAGVRRVCVDPSSLPSREALRALVREGAGVDGH